MAKLLGKAEEKTIGHMQNDFSEGSDSPDNVDNAEDQAVLAPHRQVASVSVTDDRVLLRRNAQHRMHLAERADEVRVGIGGEQD